MNIREYIRHLLLFLILIFIQILIIDQILSNYTYKIYIYTFPILTFPSTGNQYYLLIISFVLGLILDIFTNNYGLYSFSITLIAYFSKKILYLIKNDTVTNNKFFLHKTHIIRKTVFSFIIISINFLSILFIESIDHNNYINIKSLNKTIINIIINTVIYSFF